MIEDLKTKVTSEINSNSKSIRNFIEDNYTNRSLGSKEEYEQAIRMLRSALNILVNEGQDNFEASFSEFSTKINLPEQIVERILFCYSS